MGKRPDSKEIAVLDPDVAYIAYRVHRDTRLQLVMYCPHHQLLKGEDPGDTCFLKSAFTRKLFVLHQRTWSKRSRLLPATELVVARAEAGRFAHTAAIIYGTEKRVVFEGKLPSYRLEKGRITYLGTVDMLGRVIDFQPKAFADDLRKVGAEIYADRMALESPTVTLASCKSTPSTGLFFGAGATCDYEHTDEPLFP